MKFLWAWASLLSSFSVSLLVWQLHMVLSALSSKFLTTYLLFCISSNLETLTNTTQRYLWPQLRPARRALQNSAYSLGNDIHTSRDRRLPPRTPPLSPHHLLHPRRPRRNNLYSRLGPKHRLPVHETSDSFPTSYPRSCDRWCCVPWVCGCDWGFRGNEGCATTFCGDGCLGCVFWCVLCYTGKYSLPGYSFARRLI